MRLWADWVCLKSRGKTKYEEDLFFHPLQFAPRRRRGLLMVLHLCGYVCTWGPISFQWSQKFSYLPPAEPASSPGGGEIDTCATLMHYSTHAGSPQSSVQRGKIQSKWHSDGAVFPPYFKAHQDQGACLSIRAGMTCFWLLSSVTQHKNINRLKRSNVLWYNWTDKHKTTATAALSVNMHQKALATLIHEAKKLKRKY